MANIFQQGRKKGRDLRPGWRVMALFWMRDRGCAPPAVDAGARRYRQKMTVDDITSLDALRRYFSEQTGFVRAKWSGNPASEDMLKDFGATIRCIPYEQSGTAGRCVITAASVTMDAIFAKAY